MVEALANTTYEAQPINGRQLQGLKVVVVGFGALTGMAVTRFLVAHGAEVTAYDRRSHHDLKAAIDHFADSKDDIHWQLGDQGKSADNYHWIADQDLLVASPGVPLSEAIFEASKKLDIAIISEVELAWRHTQTPIIAVTGTNGKTTCCHLIAGLLERAGKRVFLGGNYGNPLINACGGNYDYIVAELSSFQLETIDKFRPHIAVLLNVTADHLDRHGSIEHYQHIKEQIFANQRKGDFALLNTNLTRVTTNPEVTRFEVDEQQLDQHTKIDLRSSPLLGRHNYFNLTMMAKVGEILGIEEAVIVEHVKSAKGLPHRLEIVAMVDGIQYINDSKSTTVASTLEALKTVTDNLVIILGGKDKGSDYSPLRPLLAENHVKAIVAYGSAAPIIATSLEMDNKITQIVDFREAVRVAQQQCQSGDALLLSPAASSLDQFQDYCERGDTFRDIVTKECR